MTSSFALFVWLWTVGDAMPAMSFVSPVVSGDSEYAEAYISGTKAQCEAVFVKFVSTFPEKYRADIDHACIDVSGLVGKRPDGHAF